MSGYPQHPLSSRWERWKAKQIQDQRYFHPSVERAVRCFATEDQDRLTAVEMLSPLASSAAAERITLTIQVQHRVGLSLPDWETEMPTDPVQCLALDVIADFLNMESLQVQNVLLQDAVQRLQDALADQQQRKG